MEKMTFDSFTKKIYIKASIEQLYDCWTTSAGLESWFLREAKFVAADEKVRKANDPVQEGDRYTWSWHNWDGEEKGTILQANGRDFLEFSFANDICKVTVALEERPDAVLVTLKQFDMPTDEDTKMNVYNGCSCGWTFWLTNLKAYLEHRILLNETQFDVTDIPQSEHIFVNI